uniref:Transposase MuDR plant domain-containing protein n=1 Tax=Fagus sylvatica TaxID=28930 RepID=A0A2N9GDJ9_FAGSY
MSIYHRHWLDGCGPNRSDENAQGVQDDHLDDVFMASQTLHDFDDVHDDYEDELCELIINDCDSHEDDDIHAQHSTPCIPTMEAPSPSFIANTWDNISVPCDDMVTPLSSWDKELEFRKGLIFSNKAEVQHAVKIYSIKRNQRYKVYESNLTQWAVYCTNECSWKLRACQRKKHGFWEITKYYGPHTCTNLDVSKDGKMLDSNLIEREIHHLVVKDHAVTIGTLDAEIFKEYKAKVSYFKLWDAKQKAIARIYGDWVKSYEILPMFMAAVQDANPNTVVKWKKKDGIERNTEIFHRVFWAFGPCIAGFIHCRPVINIDATHLYGKYQGKLLIAMGQDADNGVYPLAFAVVENESKDSWMWFLMLHQRNMSHNGKAVLIRIRKFNTTMECIRRYNEEARIRLDEIPVERWTCSHDGGHRYGAMTTNLVECFNGVLERCRAKAGGHTVTMFDRNLGVFEIRTSPNLGSSYRGDHTHQIRLTEQLACYSRPFEPVKDELYWEPIEGPTLRPDPTMARQKGRPKSTRIRNEMDWRESQPKPRCGICQVEGHNRRTCPNASMASTSGAGTN